MAHPALVESLFRRKTRNLSIFSTTKDSDDMSFIDEHKIKIRFVIHAQTSFGWEVNIVGNIKELGSWNVSDAIALTTNRDEYPNWVSHTLNISASSFPFVFEYKYIMINSQKHELKWESFTRNRIAKCPEKTPKNFVHEIHDTFNIHSTNELRIATKSDFVQALSKIPFMKSLEEQLQELSDLLVKEVVSYNTLALSCITVKNMKNPVGSDYSLYNPFIDWCSQNITVQQTKILLSATFPTYLWLDIPTTELEEKINFYQEACQDTFDDLKHLKAISELRMALLNEHKTSEDISGLLISDTYLEKNQVQLLERIIEGLEENEIWKIIDIGIWISQMLFLQSIKPKQTSTMITQFQKLKKQESNEILKDIISELFTLILDMYSELHSKVNHQECEALAALLQSEYKIIHHGIFQVCSIYLLKCIPILNNKLLGMPFLCYNSGSARGNLVVYKEHMEKSNKDCIFVTEFITEDLEIPQNATALVVIFLDSLYYSSLLQARKMNIPVVAGFFPPVIEGEYILTVNEDLYTIQRA
ncbi:hypothetical protein SteCoe_34111 [Stentor coeruleus]|uniref:CBM20 domain-containing protein n=1 Tax=Stentor coeruleus TaxID=5963 RepID=A0A1R2AV76_9CILI|nr:hypothetical protein SteCoe_34111 [Stentor coeruleus]